MSLTAAAIRVLAEMGLTAAQIADVADAQASQASSADPKDAKRAYDRERMREIREVVRRRNDIATTPPPLETKVSPTPLSKTQSPPVPPKGTPYGVSQKVPTVEAEAFDRFWSAYPRKVGKAAARKAFGVAWRKLPPLDEEAVLAGGLERAMAGWKLNPRQFTPHASTWLNDERWTDELDLPEAAERMTLTQQIGADNDASWQITQRLLEAERSGDRHRDQSRIGGPQHALPSPADGDQPAGAMVSGLVRGFGRIPH